MSGKSKSKDVLPVAASARGGKLSTGYAKPRGSVSTPESKLKSTPDKKSTSSQSPAPASVPHYLRASTGSCHDFCKYGGRHAAAEEERKGGSHSSKKKSRLREGPKWKDIPSYDAVSKTAKPQVVQLDSKKLVQLDSKKLAVPTKTKLERPAALARQNLPRRVSLGASSSGTKPVMLTPVKGVSSAPAKAKTDQPKINRKDSATLSSRPKKQEKIRQKVTKGPTDTVKNCAAMDMGPTCTMDQNGGDEAVERTLFVVEPELKFETVHVDDKFYKEKTIEEVQPNIKETTEIDYEIEEPRVAETNEAFKCGDDFIGNASMECLISETDKSIQENSIQISPDEEAVVVIETELGEKGNNSVLDKGIAFESEHEESKNSEPEDGAVLKFVSISENAEPDSELDYELSADEEQSMESESQSESESISLSRSVSSGSVGSGSGNDKPRVERNQRRSSSNQLEEKQPYKLKFKPGRVIDLKPDSDHGPRRLKFRKPRVAGAEGENSKSSSDARKVSYKKRSGSGLTGSSSVDQKSAGVVLRHQDGVERKEGQNGLFNNVIEETASKLVESRKSKVKALVGAFETVISLQDGKPASST